MRMYHQSQAHIGPPPWNGIGKEKNEPDCHIIFDLHQRIDGGNGAPGFDEDVGRHCSNYCVKGIERCPRKVGTRL